MPRLELHDTMMNAVIKMSSGNPGAAVALAEMTKVARAVDPQAAFGALGVLLSLDQHKIYGSNIWILYKDVCGKDARRCLVVLRAVQLGYLSEGRLQSICADGPSPAELTPDEFTDLDAKVCEYLADFQRPTKQPAPTGA